MPASNTIGRNLRTAVRYELGRAEQWCKGEIEFTLLAKPRRWLKARYGISALQVAATSSGYLALLQRNNDEIWLMSAVEKVY